MRLVALVLSVVVASPSVAGASYSLDTSWPGYTGSQFVYYFGVTSVGYDRANDYLFVGARDFQPMLRRYSGFDGVQLTSVHTPPYYWVSDISTDASGNVYTLDVDRNVAAFTPAGEKLWSASLRHGAVERCAAGSDGTLYVWDATYEQVYAVKNGIRETAFLISMQNGLNVTGLGVGPDGLLYVANAEVGAVQVYDPKAGRLVRSFPLVGTPYWLAVGSDGYVYVSYRAEGVVRKFSPTGAVVQSFATWSGAGAQQLTVDGSGNVYVIQADWTAYEGHSVPTILRFNSAPQTSTVTASLPSRAVDAAYTKIQGSTLPTGTCPTVVLETSSDGQTWRKVSSTVADAAGKWTVSARLVSNGYLRARVETSSEVAGSDTAPRRLSLMAKLGTPTVASSVRTGARFSVKGTLFPRHSVGSRPVVLRLQRYESGGWVTRVKVSPVITSNSVSANTSYYSYSTSLRLRGRWRAFASHGDSKHVLSYSTPRYFSVQ